ncbi:hypothetical protein ACLI4R_02715 [Natrialbaceae archaeon A-chndr2]
MKRRGVLAGFGSASVLGLTGCLGDLEDDAPGESSNQTDADSGSDGRSGADGERPEIVDVSYETGVETQKGISDDPAVSFEETAVHATGRYSTGSACYDDQFHTPRYDTEKDQLQISLTRERNDREECEDLEETTSYRVIVEFDNGLPSSVRVNEDMGGLTEVDRP